MAENDTPTIATPSNADLERFGADPDAVVPPTDTAPPSTPSPGEETPKILGKYKDYGELERAHQELEATLGRQANEIGALRQQAEAQYTPPAGQPVAPTPPPTVDADLNELTRNPRQFAQKVAQEVMQGQMGNVQGQIAAMRLTGAIAQCRAKYADFGQYEPNIREYLRQRPWRLVDDGCIDEAYWIQKGQSAGQIAAEAQQQGAQAAQRRQQEVNAAHAEAGGGGGGPVPVDPTKMSPKELEAILPRGEGVIPEP